MLQEAQSLKKSGIDVVIGVLETHGRKDTAMQSEGLEFIPLLKRDEGNLHSQKWIQRGLSEDNLN